MSSLLRDVIAAPPGPHHQSLIGAVSSSHLQLLNSNSAGYMDTTMRPHNSAVAAAANQQAAAFMIPGISVSGFPVIQQQQHAGHIILPDTVNVNGLLPCYTTVGPPAPALDLSLTCRSNQHGVSTGAGLHGSFFSDPLLSVAAATSFPVNPNIVWSSVAGSSSSTTTTLANLVTDGFAMRFGSLFDTSMATSAPVSAPATAVHVVAPLQPQLQQPSVYDIFTTPPATTMHLGNSGIDTRHVLYPPVLSGLGFTPVVGDRFGPQSVPFQLSAAASVISRPPPVLSSSSQFTDNAFEFSPASGAVNQSNGSAAAAAAAMNSSSNSKLTSCTATT